VQDRGVEGREREGKRGREGRPRLLCRSDGGRGYMKAYWRARPGTAKLTASSKSQVPILQLLFLLVTFVNVFSSSPYSSRLT
jgi:hypothetical protein